MVRNLVRQGDWLAKIDLKDPNPGTSLSSDVSPVYLKEKSVPVPVPSIRTLMCPPSVYKSDETNSSLSQREGIKLIIYLDDLLIISSSPKSCQLKST